MARRRRKPAAPGSRPKLKTAWPKGQAAFYAAVRKWAPRLLTARVVVVDPSTGATSRPGWAIIEGGAIVASGTLPIESGGLVTRLLDLWRQLRDTIGVGPTVLVIEKLRGSMVHASLHWAAGVTVAALEPNHVIEIPICVWKAAASQDATYAKGDEADARAMARACLLLAAGAAPDGSGAEAVGADGADSARPRPASRRPRADRGATPRAGRVRRADGVDARPVGRGERAAGRLRAQRTRRSEPA